MNILMVHPHDIRYDPWTIRILALARCLQDRGHSVQLVHLPRRDAPAHAPLRELCDNDPACHDLKPRQQHVIHNYRLMKRLAVDCDVIHLQKCFAATALPLLWISRLTGKPLHYDWDDDETAISRIVEKRIFSRWQLSIYERMLPNFASTLTYASKAIRDRALKLGFPEERLWHLPVGADINRFTPDNRSKDILKQWNLDPDKLTVLYIGQLEGAAHANLLVDAAPHVIAQHHDIQFLIAGGGEQEDNLRKIVEQSTVRDSIYMTGYVNADVIPELVGAADICIASFEDSAASRAKSPLKIAEYLASGKPVVASRVGEVPWMIQDCGILVDPGDSDAIAQGILQYAANPDRRISDGERARHRALEHFTWDRGADTLIKSYESAAQNNPNHS